MWDPSENWGTSEDSLLPFSMSELCTARFIADDATREWMAVICGIAGMNGCEEFSLSREPKLTFPIISLLGRIRRCALSTVKLSLRGLLLLPAKQWLPRPVPSPGDHRAQCQSCCHDHHNILHFHKGLIFWLQASHIRSASVSLWNSIPFLRR